MDTPSILKNYYNYLYKQGRNGNTAIHYHVLIRMALKEAIKLGLVEKNIADLIDRPKKEKYEASFYNKQELKKLLEVIKDDPLELVINTTAYYGLRRSEVLGLKWSAIDFENKMKNKTSNRTLPLIPQIEKLLLMEKQKQAHNKNLCGKSYCGKYFDYVCVDPLGVLLKPNYLTQHFRILQDNNKLKRIRFHDLSHSCASLMLANGVPMKQIQEWLGHSTFQTTADIYAHLDYSSKISSAQAISTALNFEEKAVPKEKQLLTEVDEEIEELERMLAEKRRKRKEIHSEM